MLSFQHPNAGDDHAADAEDKFHHEYFFDSRATSEAGTSMGFCSSSSRNTCSFNFH